MGTSAASFDKGGEFDGSKDHFGFRVWWMVADSIKPVQFGVLYLPN
jgi:hypothetical protein